MPNSIRFSVALIILLLASASFASQSYMAKVIGISDGDTIKVLQLQRNHNLTIAPEGQIQYYFLCSFINDSQKSLDFGSEPEFDQVNLVQARELIDQMIPFKKEAYRKAFEHFSLL